MEDIDRKGVTAIDFKTVLDEMEMRALGHGRLRMRLGRDDGNVLTAHLVPKFSCDLFDAVLSLLPADSSDDGAQVNN